MREKEEIKMARYVQDIPTQLDGTQVQQLITEFAAKEGFELVTYKGQNVYKKGFGFFLGPQYFTYYYQNNVFHLEAWIKFAVLPGIYAGELGIDGFLGALPKKQLHKRVEQITAMIQQGSYNPQ